VLPPAVLIDEEVRPIWKWSSQVRRVRAGTRNPDGVESGSTSALRNSVVPRCKECRLVTPIRQLSEIKIEPTYHVYKLAS